MLIARRANFLFPDPVIQHILKYFSLDISGRYIDQNEPQPFLQADAKNILADIQKRFSISKYDIADEMIDTEIAQDVKIIISDIHSLLGP